MGISILDSRFSIAVILSRVDDEGSPKRSKLSESKDSLIGSIRLVEREAIDRITHAHDLDHTLDPAEES